MRIRQLDPLRLRAMLFRLMTIASIIVPFVLAACGDDDGGGGPAY